MLLWHFIMPTLELWKTQRQTIKLYEESLLTISKNREEISILRFELEKFRKYRVPFFVVVLRIKS
jgi:hypothetical protein